MIFLFFHWSSVDVLNIVSTCRDMLCVDINVGKHCVDHGSNENPPIAISNFVKKAPQKDRHIMYTMSM